VWKESGRHGGQYRTPAQVGLHSPATGLRPVCCGSVAWASPWRHSTSSRLSPPFGRPTHEHQPTYFQKSSINIVSDIAPPTATSQIKDGRCGIGVVNMDQSPLVLAPPPTFPHHQHTSSDANIWLPAVVDRTSQHRPDGLPVPVPVRPCSVSSGISARITIPFIEHDEIPAIPTFHARCHQPGTTMQSQLLRHLVLPPPLHGGSHVR